MSLSLLEALPFRDDLEFDPVPEHYYRAKAHPNLVFQWKKFGWWAFSVSFYDQPSDQY